jgi:hypothetical protein
VKKLTAAKWPAGLLVVLIACLATGMAYAQTPSPEDLQKAVQSAYANCEATRKIVDNAIKGLDPKLGSGATEGLKHEVADAKEWFKKADDLLAQSKKKMDEKKFDKELVENLNQAWRWYVEAGSAAVRASMMD